ncbi:MAG: hypothetical protein WC268_02935 [Patescibacteria group bacterium]|jgi:hypothetical protein
MLIKKAKDWLQKIYQWFKIGERVIYLEFAIISFFILGPLVWHTGYVFAIDMVFVPKLRFPAVVDSFYLLHALFWLFNLALPSWLIQKFLLFLVPFLSGISMYRLITTESRWPKYFAAFFYIFNPFTYSRFLYGHLLILLAYALTPFVIKAIIDFFNDLSWRRAFRVVGWLTVITLVDFRSTFFILFFLAVYGLIFLALRVRQIAVLKKLFFYAVVMAAVFTLVNSFWLVPSVLGHNQLLDFVTSGIDNNDILAFQTVSDNQLGIFWNTAAMYGFWGDRELTYVPQKDIVPYWFPLFLVILLVAIWGLVSTLFLNKKFKFYDQNQDGNRLVTILTLLIIGLFSWIFVIGVAHPYTRPLVSWLYQNIVYFKGYREPQKFISLLVLVYAYLGAWGVDNLIKLLPQSRWFSGNKIWRGLVVTALITLPLLYSPGLLYAFGGQLKNSQYPASWFEVNQLLNEDPNNFKTLVLPWHQYLEFPWSAGKTIGNPADTFFDQPVIAGDNIEMKYIYTQSSRPESKFIEDKIISNPDRMIDLGESLNKLNIKYVILATGGTSPTYLYLNNSPDLQLIYWSEEIALYINKTWPGK